MESTAEQFDVHEATTHLSRLLDRVEQGEEIVISSAGTPVARLVPVNPRASRSGRGRLAGRLQLSADWDSPEVNETVARQFGSGDEPRLLMV